MRLRILSLFPLFALLAFFLTSCSNPQKDYQPIQQLQVTFKQAILNTSDDSLKVTYCDTVIAALQRFIVSHPKGEWNTTADDALTVWRTKRDSLFHDWQIAKDSLQEIATRATDFQKVQELQNAADNLIQHTFDYAVRLKSCSDMISALQDYLTKYPTGEWSTSAQTALMSWESRRAAFLQGLHSLLDRLSSLMTQRAIQEAQRIHNFSKVERVQLQSSDTTSTAGLIHVTSTYAVRMVAVLLREDIFKLHVTVSGEIDPRTNQALVDNNVQVVQ